MNKIIKDQLNKCQIATIPPFTDDDTTLLIRKSNNLNSLTFEINKCYLIQVAPYILNPPEGFSLNSNWNRNIPIMDEYINICILKDIGQMIEFDGAGQNSLTMYNNMWLPKQSFKIIKEI